MKTPSPAFQAVLDALTIEQALTWDGLIDKWVYIDDYILAPANIPDNSYTVHTVEARFDQLLTLENQP